MFWGFLIDFYTNRQADFFFLDVSLELSHFLGWGGWKEIRVFLKVLKQCFNIWIEDPFFVSLFFH